MSQSCCHVVKFQVKSFNPHEVEFKGSYIGSRAHDDISIVPNPFLLQLVLL